MILPEVVARLVTALRIAVIISLDPVHKVFSNAH